MTSGGNKLSAAIAPRHGARQASKAARIVAATTVMIASALWAGAAFAESSLIGRKVSVQVLTYNDPAKPMFDGRTHRVVVGAGVEFRLGREGMQNGLDVAAVSFDIGAARIEGVYPPGPEGSYVAAKFNGYVFDFATDCALFEEARIDRKATTLALSDEDVYVRGGRLYVNTAKIRDSAGKRFAIDVKVAPCRIN